MWTYFIDTLSSFKMLFLYVVMPDLAWPYFKIVVIDNGGKSKNVLPESILSPLVTVILLSFLLNSLEGQGSPIVYARNPKIKIPKINIVFVHEENNSRKEWKYKLSNVAWNWNQHFGNQHFILGTN